MRIRIILKCVSFSFCLVAATGCQRGFQSIPQACQEQGNSYLPISVRFAGGMNRAVTRTVPVHTTDGNISIGFRSALPGVNSIVAGIEILPLPANTTRVAFIWPVSGRVAANANYANGGPHSGTVDIDNKLWTTVVAARTGTVVFSGWMEGDPKRDGWSVVLFHPGSTYSYQTMYAHLAQPSHLAVGATVSIGDPIGYLGTTGSTESNHMHFVILRGATTLDPNAVWCDNGGNTDVSCDGYVQATKLNLPGVDIGAYVTRGISPPGDFPGLDAISAPGPWTQSLRTRSTPVALYSTDTSSKVLGMISSGGTEVVAVDYNSDRYKTTYNGVTGWFNCHDAYPSEHLIGSPPVTQYPADTEPPVVTERTVVHGPVTPICGADSSPRCGGANSFYPIANGEVVSTYGPAKGGYYKIHFFRESPVSGDMRDYGYVPTTAF